MNNLLAKRNTIYGIMAVWIIIFHIFRRISMPYIPIVTNLIGIGNMAVDVFFFFSGLCLTLSANKHNYQEFGWKDFYCRRFVRILVPYFIICIPYYLWATLFEISGGIGHKIVYLFANISSASFWIKGVQTTWYAYGILCFYLLFPLLYRYIRKIDTNKRIIMILGLIALAVFTAYVPIVKNSTIVWARLPIFSIGIMVGRTSNIIKKSLKIVILSIIILLLLGLIISVSEVSGNITILQVYRLILYIPMTISFVYILSLFEGKFGSLEWVGGLSFEIYLIHITLLHPLKYYGVIDMVGYWLYLILPVISIVLAWIIGKIEKYIIQRLGV